MAAAAGQRQESVQGKTVRIQLPWSDGVWSDGWRMVEAVSQPGDDHYFHIHESNERVVAAAPFRDRVVHHAIVRVVEPLFEKRFIEDSFACREGKGTHAAMRRALHFSERFPDALKCDVQSYFPRIDHGLLMSLVARVVGDRQVLTLIARVLETHHDSVRQVWPRGSDLFDVGGPQDPCSRGRLARESR